MALKSFDFFVDSELAQYAMMAQGNILDGCRLIRPIGRGGFGEVWLCQLEATGEFKALKFLSASDSGQHVNRIEGGLFYTMPLADGLQDVNPDDPGWCPKTLAALIADRTSAPKWFSAAEIVQIMIPLLCAVQQLSDAAIIHRDIKPENILFIGGRPCLGDISLLGDDAAIITRRGTPGYAAPSWYLESGGNPDMWGMATTLYSLATGNSPDKLGRGAFLWPPQGEQSVDRKEWNRFHQIVLRATHEKANERFLRIDAMAEALQGEEEQTVSKKAHISPWKHLAAVCILGVIGIGMWTMASSKKPTANTPESPRLNSSSVGSESFEGKLAAATAEFESLHKEALAALAAADHQEHVAKMRELITKLETQKAAPIGDIRKTFADMEVILPEVCKELGARDRKKLGELASDLLHTAQNLDHIATNADETFKAQRATRDLTPIAVNFLNEVTGMSPGMPVDTWVDQQGLNRALSSAVEHLHDAVVKKGMQEEGDEIQKAGHNIEAKIQ